MANIYDSSSRICVPLFFMISGYLLLEKNESLQVFFRKRFKKVVPPLLVWSVIYVFWKVYYDSSSHLSAYLFYSIAFSPAYYHLWFMYAIFGAYLFVPILRAIINCQDKAMPVYYLFAWFVTSSLVPFIENIANINGGIYLFCVPVYSGYFLLGYLLGNRPESTKSAIVSAIAFIVCISLTSVGTYFLTSGGKGILNELFFAFGSPNIVVMSDSAFILLKHRIKTNKSFLGCPRMLSVLHSLSSASFGIYLIHPMLLSILREGSLGISLSGFDGSPTFSIPATAVAAFLLSYLGIIFMKKAPLINKIVP